MMSFESLPGLLVELNASVFHMSDYEEVMHFLFDGLVYNDGGGVVGRHWNHEDIVDNLEDKETYSMLDDIFNDIYKEVNSPYVIIKARLIGEDTGSVLLDLSHKSPVASF